MYYQPSDVLLINLTLYSKIDFLSFLGKYDVYSISLFEFCSSALTNFYIVIILSEQKKGEQKTKFSKQHLYFCLSTKLVSIYLVFGTP